MDAIKKKCQYGYQKRNNYKEKRIDTNLNDKRVIERIGEIVNKGNKNGKNDGMNMTCKMDFNKEEIERDKRKNVRVYNDKCRDLPELNDDINLKT
ncbi:21357_t:CDS:2, partial [Gigaspora margarita]